MPKSSNQKLRILYLMDFFRRETDENHPVSVGQITDYIGSLGIKSERKTIYDDIEMLKMYGEDIVLTRGKGGGYFCASHKFDLSEIKLLVDSVQSSKFIPEKKSIKLISKLEELTNIYEAGQLQRQVYVTNRVKSMRESVFNNVDYISAAINEDKAITFKYYTYDLKKTAVYKHDGKNYEISPFALIWDDENYYMLGYDSEAGAMKHFRVDKMDKISITENFREGKKEFSKVDMSQYNIKIFGMFSGREETVKIRFKNNLIGVVIDRFGKNIAVVPDGEDHFTISVKAQISPQFYAWLFGFANECEILSPECVRDEYIKKIKETAKLYRRKDTDK